MGDSDMCTGSRVVTSLPFFARIKDSYSLQERVKGVAVQFSAPKGARTISDLINGTYRCNNAISEPLRLGVDPGICAWGVSVIPLGKGLPLIVLHNNMFNDK